MSLDITLGDYSLQNMYTIKIVMNSNFKII